MVKPETSRSEEDPRRAWPPALIELSIMEEVHRLAFILKRVMPQFAQPYNDVTISDARMCIARFESVLDAARLPASLHEVLRMAIDAFAGEARPLPAETVDRLYEETVVCLHRDLPALPENTETYRARVAGLASRPWIGDHARAIPCGWLPICERAARIGEASIPAAQFDRVSTVMLAERFARLEWVIGGHDKAINALTAYTRTASSLACMACGARGEGNGGHGTRILTLCAAHRQLRRTDEHAFQRALYSVD